MKTARVMIVDDDSQSVQATAQFFAKKKDVHLSGVANNGQEALALLPMIRPDVVLLDIVMPIVDGYGFMEGISGVDHPAHMKVIVLSNLRRDSFVAQAMEMGAYYFMCKPCNYDLLHKRILAACEDKDETLPAYEKAESLRSATDISRLLCLHGISSGTSGYDFLQSAIEIGSGLDALSGKITKEIYPAVARMHGTTAYRVERSIRHAIDKCWGSGNMSDAFFTTKRPSNGEYIARMVQLVTPPSREIGDVLRRQ